MPRFWLWAVGACCVLAVFLSGCQRYDMEVVEPLAVRSVTVRKSVAALGAKPDLMLMVDRSGSMLLPIDPTDSRCAAGCGTVFNPCGSTCPTRWSELRGAMDGFLTRHGDVARMGLTVFAGPYSSLTPSCTPGTVQVDTSQSSDVPSELIASAAGIQAAISAISPNYGTPTGTTLKVLDGYAPLQNPERDDYVLLLTDGLPNCNPDNPHDYNQDATACRCTDPSASTCAAAGKLSCLDQDATVASIQALTARDVKTIVVGFGAEAATGDAPAVLSAMGKAGGFTITCPGGTDAECLGGTCNLADQTCSNTYYQARDGVALADALARLTAIFDPFPCDYTLPVEPTDPSLLSVRIDGEAVQPGPDTWQYVPPAPGTSPEVKLVGALCQQARATTTVNRMDVVINVLQLL